MPTVIRDWENDETMAVRYRALGAVGDEGWSTTVEFWTSTIVEVARRTQCFTIEAEEASSLLL